MMKEANSYIQYIRLFKLETKLPTKIQQLNDGLALSEMLGMVTDFPSLHERIDMHPQTFANRFSNIKLVKDCIEEYWRNIIGSEMDCEQIDLVDIAHDGKVSEIVKLVVLFIRTVVQSENHNQFIQKILSTTGQTQELFMSIIEKTIGNKSVESPRKEKEKRMYDKLIELDHENDKLLNIITPLCEQKLELQVKVKALTDNIMEKRKDISHLSELLENYTQTPEKRRGYGIPDTTEKQGILIDNLTKKMLDLTMQHEKELSNYRQQIQYLSNKCEMVSELQGRIETYKFTIQSNKHYQTEIKQLQSKNAKQKLLLLQKDDLFENLKLKISNYHSTINSLQEREIEYKIESERKNRRIEDLIQSQHSYNRSYHEEANNEYNTLFSQCPQITDQENETLFESNKLLRAEIQRTMCTLKLREDQLQKLTRENKGMRKFQNENRKLTEIVSDLSAERGEENDILVGVLYQFRMKVLREQSRKRSNGKSKQHFYV